MDIFTQLVLIVARVTPNGVSMLGTGFIVRKDGLIATTRHVVGSDDTNLVILAPHIANINDYQDVSDISCRPVGAEIEEIDPTRDLAILRADLSFGGPLPRIGSFDDVSVGDSVGIFGFPHCVHGRRTLTFQRAEIGAKILLKAEGVESKHAVINTQARSGQSGSLIFSPSSQSIAGVLIGAWVPDIGGKMLLGGVDPQSLHQTTHCISADHLEDML